MRCSFFEHTSPHNIFDQMKSMVVTTLMANKIRGESQKKFEESSLDIKSLNEITKRLEKSKNLSTKIKAGQ